MKKRKNLIITVIIIGLIPLLFIGYNKFKKQNTYDEMYDEGAGVTNELFSFQARSAFGDIPNIEPKVNYFSSLSEKGEVITQESYQKDKLPKNIKNISITFYTKRKEMVITLTFMLNETKNIILNNTYRVDRKTLIKEIYLSDSEKKGGSIKKKTEMDEYLKEYNISKEQLEEWYDQGMNQILIKDWRKVYPSKYSDKKLGNLKIINEWE